MNDQYQEEFLTGCMECLLGATRSDAQGIVEAMGDKERTDLCEKLTKVIQNR